MLKSKANTCQFDVQSYHSDIHSKLRLHQLFLFLQECAWLNAQENNFGFDFVEQNNALWVLSRVYLKLTKYPQWKDRICIKTWPKNPDGFFAFRDFEIKIGEVLAGQVLSSWLIIDKNTRRPRKMSDFEIMRSNFKAKDAITHPLEKLIPPVNMEIIIQRKVQWSDIDVNAHVNNAAYVRWIMDGIFQKRKDLPIEFEINYLRELTIHQDFQLLYVENNNIVHLKIADSKGKDICVAKARF